VPGTRTLPPAIESPSAAKTRPKPLVTRDPLAEKSGLTDQSHFPVAEYPASNFEGVVVLTVGVIFILGVVFQVSPLNGSARITHWEWPWRNDIGILRAALFLLLPFVCIGQMLWRLESHLNLRVSIELGVLALGNFLLQVLGMLADPRGIGLVRQIVLSPSATSYYSDAARIRDLAGWLRLFDQLPLGFHSSTHPPGPVLFYYLFVKLFGAWRGALIGGLAVGGLGSLGVLVTYVFAGLWTENRRTRVIASAFYALLPALIVFFPEMDQVYPILAMLLILFWCRSLESTRKFPREALYLGATLVVAFFFAYNLATIAAFLAYYGLYWLWRRGWTGPALITLSRNSGIALGLCALAYGALWLATGYHAIAAFRSALAHQALYESVLHRSSALFGILDPYDFLLGAGMLALPLVLFQLWRMAPNFDPTRPEVALTVIGLATILTVDLTGVLRGEAARVWLFLQPLVAVPVALELSRFRRRWLLALFWMQWLIVVCLKAKMFFVNP
jgi:hypothetical protein